MAAGDYDIDPQRTTTLQQFLRGGGWYTGEVTGEFDDATWQALKKFQAERGIAESGQYDLATQAEMDRIIRYVAAGPETDIDRKVREIYGPGMAAYLNHPEIGPILRWAAAEGADAQRLQGYLQRTEWWKRTNASARDWDTLSVEDPEETNARRRERLTSLTNLAGTLGIKIDAQSLHNIAEDSLRLGLADNEITDLVVSMATYSEPGQGGTTTGEGEIARLVQDFRAIASDYYLTPSDKELFGYAKRVATSELTEEAVAAIFAQQAMTNHPFLAQSIEAGGTVADFYAEHRRRIANALEINEDSIDLMNDPKWLPVLGFVDGKGQRRPMTWGETMRYVNTMPEADSTTRMTQKAAQLAGMLRLTYEGVG